MKQNVTEGNVSHEKGLLKQNVTSEMLVMRKVCETECYEGKSRERSVKQNVTREMLVTRKVCETECYEGNVGHEKGL